MRSSKQHDNEPLCWSYVALVSDKHIVEPGQRLGSDDTIERAHALVNAICQDGVAPRLVVHLVDVAVALGVCELRLPFGKQSVRRPINSKTIPAKNSLKAQRANYRICTESSFLVVLLTAHSGE
jgi:hypothetical protein